VLEILIVEDNARFRDMLSATLQSGFPFARIVTAPEGDTALRQIGERQPDVIFMDIRMPGKNGIVLTREIKQQYPKIVIIVLTHLDASEYREAAFASGASFFLSKESVTIEDIQKLIETISTEPLKPPNH
jgi:DNA-binding NarL/FixJ family response regulator